MRWRLQPYVMAGGGGQGQGGGAAAARRGAAPHAAGHHARGAPATLGSVDTPDAAPAGVLIARRGTQPRLLELRRSTRRSLFPEITYVRTKRLASRARHAVGCTGLSPTPWTWAPYACLLCGDTSTSSLAGTPHHSHPARWYIVLALLFRGSPPLRAVRASARRSAQNRTKAQAGKVFPHGVDIELQPARAVQATPAGRQGQLRQGLPGAGALHERDAGRSAGE